MEFKSGSIGSFLAQTPPTRVQLAAEKLSVELQGKPTQSLPYDQITSINISSWMVGWSNVTVASARGSFEAKRLSNADAQRLKLELAARVEKAVSKAICAEQTAIQSLTASIDAMFARPVYLAARDWKHWMIENISRAPSAHHRFIDLLQHPMLVLDRLEGGLRRDVARIRDLALGRMAAAKERNRNFVEGELKKYTSFFDRVEKRPLTIEQRRAAVVMEDRNLLVAPAGSGKTSALVGKIGYALKSGFCEPSDILVVAFNKAARDELYERITSQLSGFDGIGNIQIHTFHSLGQKLIAEATGKKPSLAKTAEDDMARGKLFQNIFDSLLASKPAFRANYILFRALYAVPARNPSDFETAADWQEYVRASGQVINGKAGYRTYKQDLVKSQGELAIANWLFLNGVDYEYERPYKYETADQQHRQYKPDFYFPSVGIYLEHYALDANGRPPAAFGEKYAESMEWKRALHAEKETICLETTFDEFVRGALFEKLERELSQRGVVVKQRTDDELFEIVKNDAALGSPLAALLSVVAKHAKSNLLDDQAIRLAAQKHPSPARANFFTSLLLPVIAEYEETLRESREIDFEDMIGLAVDHLQAMSAETNFKLVLVDEFQDISRARARLVRGILDQNPGAKLFAVGDDWQAIYRFAGADIGLFWDFEEFFGPTEKLFLTQTFRFNQGIADISASFVSRNPDQVQKQVVSHDPRKSNVVACFVAETEADERATFHAIIRQLENSRPEGAPRAKAFVLARYNRVLDVGKQWLAEHGAWDVDVKFLTIHGSKGLEADYVILLGLNAKPFGFPSTQDDDPSLQIVMPRPEPFSYAEERRLLYVALTRTRNVFYAISNARAPSAFLKELVTDWGEREELGLVYRAQSSEAGGSHRWCLKCKTGVMRIRQGKHGPFKGCSRYPECFYTENTA